MFWGQVVFDWFSRKLYSDAGCWRCCEDRDYKKIMWGLFYRCWLNRTLRFSQTKYYRCCWILFTVILIRVLL